MAASDLRPTDVRILAFAVVRAPVPASSVTESFVMSKRTFQPNNRRRAKVHGFRARMRTRAGRAIVSARRGKGRAKLTA